MNIFVWAALAAAIVASSTPTDLLAHESQPTYFAPSVPGKSSLYEMRGILIELGHGNKSGGLEIVDGRGRIHGFLLAGPDHVHVKVNGAAIVCGAAPVEARHLAGTDCAHWPPTIQLESTTVYIRYFWAVRYNKQIPIAAEILLHPRPLDRMEPTPPDS